MILTHSKPTSLPEQPRFPSIGRLIRAKEDGKVYLEDINARNRTHFKLLDVLFEVPFWNDKDGSQRWPKIWDEADDTIIGDKFKLTYIGGNSRQPLIGPAIRTRQASEFFGDGYPDAEFGMIERIRRETEAMVYESVHDYASGNHTISVAAKDGGEGNVTFTLSGGDGHGNIMLDISGDVGVTIGGDANVTVVGDTSVAVSEGNVSLDVQTGNVEANIAGTLKAIVQKDITVESVKAVLVKAASKLTLDCSQIFLKNGASEPVVLGNKLFQYLNQLVTWAATHTHMAPQAPSGSLPTLPPPGPPPTPAGNMLSQISKAK